MLALFYLKVLSLFYDPTVDKKSRIFCAYFNVLLP